MNDHRFLTWFGPFFILLLYVSLRLTIASLYLGRSMTLFCIGINFAVIFFIYLLRFINKFIIGQIFSCVLVYIAFFSMFIIFWISNFRGFIIPFVIIVYMTGYSGIIMRDIIRNFRMNKSSRQNKVPRQKFKEIKELISITFIIAIGSIFLLSPYYYPYPNQTFTITSQQSQEYELVLYYPIKTDINEEFCLCMLDAGVNTVSFPMYEHEFQDGTQEELNAVYAIRNLTNFGIKSEVWPLFNYDEGHYPSISEIDRFSHLYDVFQDWIERNSLTVDYILWDIESEGEGVDMTPYENWIEPFQSLAYAGSLGKRMANLSLIWNDANQAIIDLAHQAQLDGHLVRTTTHTIIWDEFDGDGDLQMFSGIPAWDSKEAYEYISMMSYRGCEWGGDPSSSTWIYEHVKSSAKTQSGKIAICLGCINYNPYPNITSVVNDVHLALSAGVNSIRLFQGASWVYGVSPDPIKNVWGNIAHGLNSTENEGLLQLLKACRQPGQVTYYPSIDIDLIIFSNILIDILLDLA